MRQRERSIPEGLIDEPDEPAESAEYDEPAEPAEPDEPEVPGLNNQDVDREQADLEEPLDVRGAEQPRYVTPLRINLSARRVTPLRINLSNLQPQVSPLRINRSRLQSSIGDLEDDFDVSIVHGDDTVEIIQGRIIENFSYFKTLKF